MIHWLQLTPFFILFSLKCSYVDTTNTTMVCD